VAAGAAASKSADDVAPLTMFDGARDRADGEALALESASVATGMRKRRNDDVAAIAALVPGDPDDLFDPDEAHDDFARRRKLADDEVLEREQLARDKAQAFADKADVMRDEMLTAQLKVLSEDQALKKQLARVVAAEEAFAKLNEEAEKEGVYLEADDTYAPKFDLLPAPKDAGETVDTVLRALKRMEPGFIGEFERRSVQRAGAALFKPWMGRAECGGRRRARARARACCCARSRRVAHSVARRRHAACTLLAAE
jgi:hypothetical protein